MPGLVLTNSHPIDESYIERKPQPNLTFSVFSVFTQEDVRHLVKKFATKSCTLDPIPTSLLKDHLDELHELKNAAVRPLIKKVNLPLGDNNYRPVSNLSYLGKLIE